MENPSQSVCVYEHVQLTPLYLENIRSFEQAMQLERVPFQGRHNSRLEDLRQCTY